MKKEKTFPKKLKLENHFTTPIWLGEQPDFVKELNKASDPYIKKAKIRDSDKLNKRNKKFGDKGDLGYVFHSTTLIGDPDFKKLQDYVAGTSHNLLNELGYDLKEYQIFLTEMWVQEFAKKGGGHHSLHTHWNGHISGFYFLKASERTSMPVFQDPRPGNLMNSLPEKNPSKLTFASTHVNFKCEPGKMFFFPSYLPHEFIVYVGYEPFRFIHWNCQAILKSAVNYYK